MSETPAPFTRDDLARAADAAERRVYPDSVRRTPEGMPIVNRYEIDWLAAALQELGIPGPAL